MGPDPNLNPSNVLYVSQKQHVNSTINYIYIYIYEIDLKNNKYILISINK